MYYQSLGLIVNLIKILSIIFCFVFHVYGSDILDVFPEGTSTQSVNEFLEGLYENSLQPGFGRVEVDPLSDVKGGCSLAMENPFSTDGSRLSSLIIDYLTPEDMFSPTIGTPDDFQCVPSMDVTPLDLSAGVAFQGTHIAEIARPSSLEKKKNPSRSYGHVTRDPDQKKILEGIYKANPDITPEDLSGRLADHNIILNEFAAKNYLQRKGYGSRSYKHVITNKRDNAILEQICDAEPGISPQELSKRLLNNGIILLPTAASNYKYNRQRRSRGCGPVGTKRSTRDRSDVLRAPLPVKRPRVN